MGEKTPAIADDGRLIRPDTTSLFNESIYICDPMLFESRLCTSVQAAQHPIPLLPSLDASSRLIEMVIPSHKDWDPPIEAQTKILQGGMMTIVDEDVEAMHHHVRQ
jgi:hypothetical protein